MDGSRCPAGLSPFECDSTRARSSARMHPRLQMSTFEVYDSSDMTTSGAL